MEKHFGKIACGLTGLLAGLIATLVSLLYGADGFFIMMFIYLLTGVGVGIGFDIDKWRARNR